MGKIRRVLRCNNCGAVLQSSDVKRSGYVPKELLDNASSDRILYCDPCYNALQINTRKLDPHIDNETVKILDDAIARDGLIVYIIDLFTFNGSFKPELIEKLKKLKVVVVGNKRDLFPKNVTDETLIRFLNERFDEVGIKPVSIELITANKPLDATDVKSKIDAVRERRDVFIIGSYFSGKTSLMNQLLKIYSNKTKRPITRRNYPGTNLQILSLPLDNSTNVYELPGFVSDDIISADNDKTLVKYIFPKKQIKITPIKLNCDRTIIVGGLAMLSLIKGEDTVIKCHFSDLVDLKRVENKNVEKVFKVNLVKRDLRPVSDKFISFKDFDIFEYQMENDGEIHDIGIKGLGWFSFIATGQVFMVAVPSGVALKECKGKIR